MKYLVLILILLCNVANAESVEFDKNTQKYKDKKGKQYSIIDIPLISTFSYKKPNIPEVKDLDSDEKDVVEFSLKENGRRLVHKELRHRKNDYQHDFDRGSAEYTSRCRNYSFHKVVIPDGTTINETNFTQKEPHSLAIEGKNLTFKNCNLVNVELDPTWIIESCNISQIKRVKKIEEDLGGGRKKIVISHQVESPRGSGIYVEMDEYYEETDNTDDYNLAILRLNK